MFDHSSSSPAGTTVHGGPRSLAAARLTALMDELSAASEVSEVSTVSEVSMLAAGADTRSGVDGTRSCLEFAAVLERLRSWASVEQARALTCLPIVEPRAYDPDQEAPTPPQATTPHEIALVLGISLGSARARLAVAAELVRSFPQVVAATAAGDLAWWQARRVLDDTGDLTPEGREYVDSRIAAEAAQGRTRVGFTGRLRAAVLTAAPAVAEAAHLEAVTNRTVWVEPMPDGTVHVSAALAAEGADTVLTMLDRLRDSPLSVPPAGWPTEDRTADQRRADALVGLSNAVLSGLDTHHDAMPGPTATSLGATSLGATPDGANPDARATAAAVAAVAAVLQQAWLAGPAGCTAAGTRPRGARDRRGGQVMVTVSAETLLGISDAPGTLAGHGPITAGHARRLAGAAHTWRRLLTDPTSGSLLDIGRTRYSPTAALAEHVLIRGNTECTRPGCARPAAHLDHATPWAQNGSTAAANLTGLCVGDHRARHTGWTVRISVDGATTMTTTHGFTATKLAQDHRPADRPPAPPPPAPPSAPAPAPSAGPGIDASSDGADATSPAAITFPSSTLPSSTLPSSTLPSSTPPSTPDRPAGESSGAPATADLHLDPGIRLRPQQAPGPTVAPTRGRQPDTGPPITGHVRAAGGPTAAATARLLALLGPWGAPPTEFPLPSPGSVGDHVSGDGWLTETCAYIDTVHTRAARRKATEHEAAAIAAPAAAATGASATKSTATPTGDLDDPPPF